MSAWTEIGAIYRASKKRQDINWWTEWICRPPAAALVYLLRDTRVTPNQISLASLVICTAAGAMFALASGHLWLALAGLVYEISFVLDCADGQLARLRKRTSVLGHLLDFLMDEIKAMLIYASVAVYLWRAHGDLGGSELYLLIGLAGLLCVASGIACTSFMRRPEYGARPPDKDGQPAVIQRRPGLLGWAIAALEHGARFVVHYPSYIWLLAALDRLDIYFWAYTVVNVLYVGRCLLIIAWRLGRFAPPSDRTNFAE